MNNFEWADAKSIDEAQGLMTDASAYKAGGVDLLDLMEEVLHGRGRRGLEVLVEGGQAGEALPLHEVHSGRERVARRPEQPAVVGASAQAAGDAEDPHRARPARSARRRP